MTNIGDNSAAREEQRRAVFSEVREYGRDAGNGARGLVKTAAALVRAANNGLLDLTKSTDKKDDADRAYEEYKKAYSTKDEHGSITQQVSKMRAFIKLGMATSFNPMEVVQTTNRVWTEMRKAEQPTKPEYQALCAVANAQNKMSSALDEDTIRGLVSKDPAKEKDEVAFIEAAIKALEKAHELNHREETEKLVQDARGLLNLIKTDVVQASLEQQIAEAQAKLASLKAA
jgi:hypothetical protein